MMLWHKTWKLSHQESWEERRGWRWSKGNSPCRRKRISRSRQQGQQARAAGVVLADAGSRRPGEQTARAATVSRPTASRYGLLAMMCACAAAGWTSW